MLSPLAYGLLLLALLNCATSDATTNSAITSHTTIVDDINISATGAINATAPNNSYSAAASTKPPQSQHNVDAPSISRQSSNNTTANSSAHEELPLAHPLVAAPEPDPPLIGQHSRLPEFPQRTDAVYFIVAVTGGAKIWSRTLARTLIDMGPPFGSPQGPPLRPLYVDIPPNGR